MSDILNCSVTDLSYLLKNREISSYEITTEYINKILDKQSHNNAYITIVNDLAIKAAKKMDIARIKDESLSDISGIPYAVKDNICTKGIKTTCGSKMLEDFIPIYNAHVIDLLSDSILLGKTNMDEFGAGTAFENSCFGEVKNPFYSGEGPIGSSSGSAVVVASNEAAFALGSDTDGSIRQSASSCDIVGYKPSYGLVSRYGLISFASSFDQIGFLSKNVSDCALIANNILGFDNKDLTSVDITLKNINNYSIKGKKIAIPMELMTGYSKEKVVQAALSLTSEGALVENINLPFYDYFLEVYYILSSAEASSNLSKFDGIKYGYLSEGSLSADKTMRITRAEGFGDEVQKRIISGTFFLSEGHYDKFYAKAMNLRNSLIAEYNKLFDKYDFVLSPVSIVAPLSYETKQDVDLYMNNICTVTANLIGAPAISVPAGYTKNGFPTGVQLMTRKFHDKELLCASAILENCLRGEDNCV